MIRLLLLLVMATIVLQIYMSAFVEIFEIDMTNVPTIFYPMWFSYEVNIVLLPLLIIIHFLTRGLEDGHDENGNL